MKKLFIVLVLLLIVPFLVAFSPNEAITFVSRTNNYFFDSERVLISQPQVQIEYNNELYWVVSGMDGSEVGVYVPVSNEKLIADGSIEIRELIATRVVLERMFSLRNSYPASDWPFSHPVKNRFFDIENELRNLSPSIANVINDLESIDDASELLSLARRVKSKVDSFAIENNEIAELIEEGILFERDFFSNPATSDRGKYEDYSKAYFNKVNSYKNNFNELKSELDILRQGIGSFQGDMSSDQKEFYLSVLRLPSQTNALPSFFSLTDTTRTFVEEIFSASRNIERFVLNLETRKNRNSAWQVIYGFDSKINNLNNNFVSLDEAARSILLEENVIFWADQDNVSALRINYRQATQNYDRGIYDKAVSFGRDAKRNVENILNKGVEERVDNSNELIIQIIILLIIVLIVVFLAEKFYFNKKENAEEEYYGEDYYEK